MSLPRQVKMLLDGGVNYFDTSPAYCRGESERRLGEALAKSGYDRKDFFIATKLSNFAPRQYPLDEAKKILLEKEITIAVDLKDGKAYSTAWGCDLTYDYVKINGDYRS